MSKVLISEVYQITNRVTGQVIKFLKSANDTAGEYLEMEATYLPFSSEPPLHYHPAQEEFFQVEEGELTVRLNGEIRIYRKGARVHIKPNIRHSIWNSGFKPTIVNWKVVPAMNTEQFLRTMSWLSNQGKTDKKGMPSFPVLLFLLQKYRKTFRLDTPAGILLQLLYLLLLPTFFIRNYKNRFNNPSHL